MQRKIIKLISTLLTLAMVFSLFAAMPITASAAAATINIGALGGSNVSSATGVDAWNYDATNRELYLTAAGGNYTLTGTNTDLAVTVMSTAKNANVTINGINITTQTRYVGFFTEASCTLTLSGSNVVNAARSSSNALGIYNGVTCKINGNGSLKAVSADIGIINNYLATMQIIGSAMVTAEGNTAISNGGGSILLGDYASLTMTNKGTAATTRAIGRADTSTDSLWILSGSATTTDPLSNSTINITIPAVGTGKVQRVFCESQNMNTGVLYAYFDQALAAHTNNQTIALLRDAYPSPTHVSNKTVNIDLNGKVLFFEHDASDYTGPFQNTGLKVTNNGYVKLYNPNNGQLNVYAPVDCVYVDSGGKAEVTNVQTWGHSAGGAAIYAKDAGSEVTVYGNVDLGINATTSANIGVWATNGGKVTVEGRINVPTGASYIKVGSVIKAPMDYILDPAKPGYLKYTDGTSTVWVKDPGPVIIDISTLGASNTGNSGSPAQSQWTYAGGYTRALSLATPGGKYTITGTNADIRINVEAAAANAIVTLKDVNKNGVSGYSAFRAYANCTLTLEGTNNFNGYADYYMGWHGYYSPFVIENGATCTVNGAGSLTAVCDKADEPWNLEGPGVIIASNSALDIRGSAKVTAIAQQGDYSYDPAISTTGAVFISENASLTITNTKTALTRPFSTLETTPGAGWLLSGGATTTNPLTNQTISVTIPAGGTGTIRHETTECQIVETGVYYKYFAQALAAHTNNQTISLLNEAYAEQVHISNKTVNIRLNGNTVLFDNDELSGHLENLGLRVSNNGYVKLLDPNNGKINVSAGSEGLYVESGGKAEVTNVSTGGAGNGFGVYAKGAGSEATVYGNVTLGIKAITSASFGVWAEAGGKVTVEGSIIVPEGASYIKVGSVIKTPADIKTPTTKTGYLTYTDGISTVWVKERTPPTPVIIDISTLGASNTGNSGSPAQSQWTYTGGYSRTLSLATPGGKYTITGTNSDIRINVEAAAANAGVTLKEVNKNGVSGYSALRVYANCTLILEGTNNFTGYVDSWNGGTSYYIPFVIENGAVCTVNGAGSLTAVCVKSEEPWNVKGSGISVAQSSTLNIRGSAKITAAGGPAVSTTGSVYISENAVLTMATETALKRYFNTLYVFPDTKWKLTNATTTSPLTTSPIEVTVAAGATGTVQREGLPVITWNNILANGSNGTATTTQLTLNFSVDPTTLTTSHITVTGATKGALTGTGTTRTLAISNITVQNGQSVTVSIANPPGFEISPSSRTVVVYVVGGAYKPGDINRDGDVNVLDLSILLANFGKSGAAITDKNADLNNDGDVNVLDLSILLANFGK